MCFNENLEAEDCEDACPSGACEKENCNSALYLPVDGPDASQVEEDEEMTVSRKAHRSECKRGDHGPSTVKLSVS